ncbi:MAG: hypothetical protein ACRD26_10010 [Vicinamibacterales bacterium]
MRFRGTLRSISNVKGLAIWLNQRHVLLKDFGTFADRVSKQLTAHARALADEQGRPFEYLASWKIRKEDRAREILARDGIREGLIAIFECVEGCRSVRVRGNRQTKRLELVSSERRCAHLYFYYWDHDFGLLHVRLQTWLPFTIQICVNGRAWLAQQLRRCDSPFTQVDNCVFDVADLGLAQRMLRQLETRPWARVLRVFATRVNPLLRGHQLRPYYWSLEESEYATDVLFRDRASLQAVYPALVTHAFHAFRTPDVLRFLGRPAPARTAEVITRVQRRVEGVRVKHWVAENSVKMYDKHGQVLRVETTLNQPRRFKVYRVTAPGQARHWVPLRKGIADIPRRVALSQATNARYLDALSVVELPTPIHHVLDPVSQRRCVNGRPFRPLRPIAPDDSACFARLLDGRALLAGIHAANLRCVLTSAEPADLRARQRLTGRVSRLLRLYRAHGLIAKVTRTRIYRVTPKGHQIMTTALRCRAATLEQLAA